MNGGSVFAYLLGLLGIIFVEGVIKRLKNKGGGNEKDINYFYLFICFWGTNYIGIWCSGVQILLR
jgi:hypothetical protein